LTRQSIIFESFFWRWMDTRVKPAYDIVMQIVFACSTASAASAAPSFSER